MWVLYVCLLAIGFVQCEIVDTKQGKIEGGERMSRGGRPYLYWTKVPYAKPPIGKLRLASPEPMDKWEGVLKTTELVPQCPQINIFIATFPLVGQEDCLYLSVYKPKTDKKNLPVLFYIHGGSYVFSYAGVKGFADYIMDEDVILVGFEYRLGVLGFMSLNDPDLPGNFGLKDQVLAFNWVYDNIANFGGDPNKITLFGESAGGASSHYLAVLPSTKDKIAGAYLISGSLTKAWSRVSINLLKKFSENFIDKIGCQKKSVKETLECLRKIDDPMSFVATSFPLFPKATERLAVGPTIEPPGPNALVTEDMTNHKIAKTIPIIVTYTAGEYLLSEIPDMMFNYTRTIQISQDLDAFTQFVLGGMIKDDQIKEAGRKIKERYLTKKDIPGLAHEIALLFEDMTMIYPSYDLAETHEGPKWMYFLVHRGEVSLLELVNNMPPMPELTKEAFHSDELKILFNMMETYQFAKPTPEPDDLRVSKEMVKYLANFATHGNPTPKGSPFIWKPYNGNEVLQIKTEGNSYADGDFIKKNKETLAFYRSLNMV